MANIKCGTCGKSHRSVEKVKECAGVKSATPTATAAAPATEKTYTLTCVVKVYNRDTKVWEIPTHTWVATKSEAMAHKGRCPEHRES